MRKSSDNTLGEEENDLEDQTESESDLGEWTESEIIAKRSSTTRKRDQLRCLYFLRSYRKKNVEIDQIQEDAWDEL